MRDTIRAVTEKAIFITVRSSFRINLFVIIEVSMSHLTVFSLLRFIFLPPLRSYLNKKF